jgi:uncharacterized membrane protein
MKSVVPSSSPGKSAKLHRWLSRLLHLGMLSSLSFIVLGMFLLILKGGEASEQVIPLNRLASGLLGFQPEAFLNLGIFILLATPISVVISLIAFFWIHRERAYTLVSAAVLSVLLLSILLAQYRLFL